MTLECLPLNDNCFDSDVDYDEDESLLRCCKSGRHGEHAEFSLPVAKKVCGVGDNRCNLILKNQGKSSVIKRTETLRRTDLESAVASDRDLDKLSSNPYTALFYSS